MKKSWKFKSGIFLIVVSTLLFTCLAAVPFMGFNSKIKISITTVILIAGEITFWVGGILVGKELFTKYKAYFNPLNWFNKAKTSRTVESSTTIQTEVEINIDDK